jgi:putative ABC transport system ATP-binding protein
MSADLAIELRGVAKEYRRDQIRIPVLEALDLNVAEGEFLALMGPSGSGKTTLLNLIAGLDRPTAGEVIVHGQDLARMSDSQITRWRSDHVGFIFQLYNLIPVLTAEENVALPLLLTRLGRRERRERARTALRIVGLEGREDHSPRQLSGGQEQRVAIARAIVTDPYLWSPTSQRETSIATARRRSSISWNSSTASSRRPSSWSPTTQSPRRAPRDSCTSTRASSSTT